MKTCSNSGCNNTASMPGRTVCHECRKAQQRKNTKRIRDADPEAYNTAMREYNKKNYHWIRLLRYNLSLEEYNKMLKEQDNKCAICLKPPVGRYPLAIDHSHITGKVRGLLCHGCNRDISILDNKEKLEKAVAYLNKTK